MQRLRRKGAWLAIGLAGLLAAGTHGAPSKHAGPAVSKRDAVKAERDWFQKFHPSKTAESLAGLRLQALQQARQRGLLSNKALGQASLLAVPSAPPLYGTWQEKGPTPQNSGDMLVSGRAGAWAVDLAHDPTGNTVYLGAVYGGVWKSTDALSANPHFTPISDQSMSLAVGSITLDTTSNPPVIYVGTGEPHNSWDSYYGVGVMKSVDDGAHWTLVSSADNGATPFLGASFSKLLVDPANPNVLVAGTVYGNGFATDGLSRHFGVFRSTDAGATWSTIWPGVSVSDLVYDPARGAYYASIVGQGFFKSTNQGQTWAAMETPFLDGRPPDGSNFGRSSLAVRGNTLYALITTGDALSTPSAGDTGLVQSTDGGQTWTPIAAPPVSTQLWYDQVLGAPPGGNNLVIGAVFLYRTDLVNGTSTNWTSITNNIHVDNHSVAFADATHWFIANDGGAWATANSGDAWTNMNATLSTIQFHGVSADYQMADHFVGGSQDNGTATSEGALGWTQQAGGDGMYTLADPIRSIYYGSYQNSSFFRLAGPGPSYTYSGVVDSTTFGSSQWLTPFEFVPGDSNNMFVGTGNGIWRGPSNPATMGAGWQAISPGFGSVNHLAPAPTNANVLYATVGSAFYRSTNADLASPTWTQINNAPLNDGWTLDPVAVSPVDANLVYVAKAGFLDGQKVFKSTDAGQSWMNISGNLPNTPVNWIAIDPQSPNSLYVATDIGVFAALDGGVAGESWQVAGAGLPDTAVLQVRISSSTPHRLVAGTHGRGAWTLDLVSGGSPTATPSRTPILTATPTPSRTATFTVSATPTPFTGSPLKLNLEVWNPGQTTNQYKIAARITNWSAQPVALSRIKVKAWIHYNVPRGTLVADTYAGNQTVFSPSGAYQATVGAPLVSFADLAGGRDCGGNRMADKEIAIGFSDGTALAASGGYLQTNSDTNILASWRNADWSAIYPGSDYSKITDAGTTAATRINSIYYALYVDDSLVCEALSPTQQDPASGQVPCGITACLAQSSPTPTVTSTPTPTQVVTAGPGTLNLEVWNPGQASNLYKIAARITNWSSQPISINRLTVRAWVWQPGVTLVAETYANNQAVYAPNGTWQAAVGKPYVGFLPVEAHCFYGRHSSTQVSMLVTELTTLQPNGGYMETNPGSVLASWHASNWQDLDFSMDYSKITEAGTSSASRTNLTWFALYLDNTLVCETTAPGVQDPFSGTIPCWISACPSPVAASAAGIAAAGVAGNSAKVAPVGTLVAAPNPATNLLAVRYQAGADESARLTVSGLAGETVLSKDWRLRAGENDTLLSLDGLASGIYMLAVQPRDGKVSTFKFAVAK